MTNIIDIQAAQRVFRIKTIYTSIDKAMRMDANVDEEKLVAEAQFQLATARRTIMEYLKELEIIGKIVREDGKIWTAEGYKAELILRNAGLPGFVKILPKYFETQIELKGVESDTEKEISPPLQDMPEEFKGLE
jgi:hypothetical protein